MTTKNKLSFGYIQALTSTYRQNQWAAMHPSNATSKEDLATWFSLDELKSFIAEIESEVEKHPQCETNNLGIRFYFASYPDYDEWGPAGYSEFDDLGSDWANQLTLVLVPTNEVDNHLVDFNPADPTTYTGSQPTINESTTIMALNHSLIMLEPPKPKPVPKKKPKKNAHIIDADSDAWFIE